MFSLTAAAKCGGNALPKRILALFMWLVGMYTLKYKQGPEGTQEQFSLKARHCDWAQPAIAGVNFAKWTTKLAGMEQLQVAGTKRSSAKIMLHIHQADWAEAQAEGEVCMSRKSGNLLKKRANLVLLFEKQHIFLAWISADTIGEAEVGWDVEPLFMYWLNLFLYLYLCLGFPSPVSHCGSIVWHCFP